MPRGQPFDMIGLMSTLLFGLTGLGPCHYLMIGNGFSNHTCALVDLLLVICTNALSLFCETCNATDDQVAALSQVAS